MILLKLNLIFQQTSQQLLSKFLARNIKKTLKALAVVYISCPYSVVPLKCERYQSEPHTSENEERTTQKVRFNFQIQLSFQMRIVDFIKSVAYSLIRQYSLSLLLTVVSSISSQVVSCKFEISPIVTLQNCYCS